MKNDVAGALKTVGASSGPNSIRAEFCFAPTLEFFKGHFPGRPLLPGVMQFEMVRCAVEKHTANRFDIITAKKAKFTGEIRPGETITMDAEISAGDEATHVKATLRLGQKKVAEISMEMRGRSSEDKGKD